MRLTRLITLGRQMPPTWLYRLEGKRHFHRSGHMRHSMTYYLLAFRNLDHFSDSSG